MHMSTLVTPVTEIGHDIHRSCFFLRQPAMMCVETTLRVWADIENDGWKCSDTCHILLMCVGCKASIMDIFIITVYEMTMWQYARGFSKWWPCKDLSPDSAAHCGLQSFILSFSSLFSSVTATFLSWFTLTGPRHTSKSTNFKTYILGGGRIEWSAFTNAPQRFTL